MNIASLLSTKGVDVITVTPDASIREAVRLLDAHNIGALVVMSGAERPAGIVSERDIVRALARDESVLDRPVSTIMTKEVIVGAPQDDLVTVSNTMTEHRIRHLPVMDRGRLVGIVSIGDVLKAQRDHYRGEVDTLQLQILGPSA